MHQGIPYIYILVRKDLPFPQIVVQSAHACIEATRSFLDSQTEHPHLVVLAVQDEQQLQRCADKLGDVGIKFRLFIEPDRNDEATALATEPVFGEQRAHFRRYQCLTGGNNE